MRQIEKIVRELTKVESYADGWVLRAGGHLIYGYHFDVNDAAADKLCDDKSATYEVLSAAGIPAIVHVFVSVDTREALEQLTEGGYVVKPNEGTGGVDLVRAETLSALTECVAQQLQKFPRLAVSPFEKIETEYRVIVLRGRVELIYAKRLPSDGWLFNLGQGAQAEVIAENAALSELARGAARVLGVTFASVDIVDARGVLKVLEVNSGVMMETFSSLSAENFERAKEIYKKALEV
ncbi:MAG: hypothetical protein LBI11_00405 [Streptococcaceae bacterium]|jgi:glutathione synthase/RimK-type ligase-like ATP-grasp enzyme|nr:hypothetical protein [Streptococcaceae bacterium]